MPPSSAPASTHAATPQHPAANGRPARPASPEGSKTPQRPPGPNSSYLGVCGREPGEVDAVARVPRIQRSVRSSLPAAGVQAAAVGARVQGTICAGPARKWLKSSAAWISLATPQTGYNRPAASDISSLSRGEWQEFHLLGRPRHQLIIHRPDAVLHLQRSAAPAA